MDGTVIIKQIREGISQALEVEDDNNRNIIYPLNDAELRLCSKLALISPLEAEQIALDEGNRSNRILTQWLKECFTDEVASSVKQRLGNSNQQQRRGSLTSTSAEGTVVNEKPLLPSVPLITGSTVAGGGVLYHCNICGAEMSGNSFRVRCAECIDDFDLCAPCFCQGKESGEHVRTHCYIPLGPHAFPLFDSEWSADEDLKLVESVGRLGFGNWASVAEIVATVTPANFGIKDERKCEERFLRFHLTATTDEGLSLNPNETPTSAATANSSSRSKHIRLTETEILEKRDPLFPFKHLLKQPPPHLPDFLEILDSLRPPTVNNHKLPNSEAIASYKHELPSPDSCIVPLPVENIKEKSESLYEHPAPVSSLVAVYSLILQTPPKPPPKTLLYGYWTNRGDFDVEYSNEAEMAIVDLSFGISESAPEKQLKLAAVEDYNCVLDERLVRKKLAIAHKLFDQKRILAVEKTKSPEQRSLLDLLKPLWRYKIAEYQLSAPPLFRLDPTAPAVFPSEEKDCVANSELDELVSLVLDENALKERLDLLATWHAAGLATVEDVYEKGSSVATATLTSSFATVTSDFNLYLSKQVLNPQLLPEDGVALLNLMQYYVEGAPPTPATMIIPKKKKDELTATAAPEQEEGEIGVPLFEEDEEGAAGAEEEEAAAAAAAQQIKKEEEEDNESELF